MSFITLDIDRNTDKQFINYILEKISKCDKLIDMQISLSNSLNGFHILLNCDISCYLCRMVFDDQLRLDADFDNRASFEQNVLFDEKHIFTKNYDLVLKK